MPGADFPGTSLPFWKGLRQINDIKKAYINLVADAVRQYCVYLLSKGIRERKLDDENDKKAVVIRPVGDHAFGLTACAQAAAAQPARQARPSRPGTLTCRKRCPCPSGSMVPGARPDEWYTIAFIINILPPLVPALPGLRALAGGGQHLAIIKYFFAGMGYLAGGLPVIAVPASVGFGAIWPA